MFARYQRIAPLQILSKLFGVRAAPGNFCCHDSTSQFAIRCQETFDIVSLPAMHRNFDVLHPFLVQHLYSTPIVAYLSFACS